MGNSSDAFSIQLLEEAKRFLEKANETQEADAFLHAALVLAFSALESHLNGVADELALRKDVTILDEAILSERGFALKGGRWELSPDMKFYRLEDRILYLFRRFANADATEYAWWSDFKEALKSRNSLVHPRNAIELGTAELERFVTAIVHVLNDVYLAVFKKGHPAYGRGVQSTLSF